jgi:hypothetical protein
MAFEESQSWYTLVTEVCVAFDTVLNKIAEATRKKRKLYTRPCGRLHGTWEKVECMVNMIMGFFSKALLRRGYFALRALERLRVEEV